MKTVVVNASNTTQVLYGTNNRGDGLDLNGTYGDVMVEIPRFYVCSTYSNGNFSYWISPDPQEALNYTVHPMFNQRGTGTGAGTAAPYFYVGRYVASNGGSSKLQSATGKSPWVSNTLNTFRTYAENKGTGWGVSNIWTYAAIRQLFFTEMVTLNSQTAWVGSRGNVDSSAALNSGADSIDTAIFTTNATGNGTGVNGKTPVSYRGIENLWGNLWLFHDGLTATTADTRVINATGLGLTGQATTFAVPLGGNDYQSVGTLSTASGKWQINLKSTDVARSLFLTSDASNAGSETTYLSDYYWSPQTTSTTNPDVLITGGDWTGSGYAGISYLDLSQALSFTATNRGVRLEYRFNAPSASFSSTNISLATNTTSQGWEGIAPFTMQFTDTSSNTPTSWKWARNNLTSTTWTVFNTSQNARDSFSAGNWSVNLTATNTWGSGISSQKLWVNVSQAAPTVTSITPSSGQNTTSISITNLSGTGFYGTPTVNLTRAEYSNITATGVTLVSDNKLTCTFDLTNKVSGTWSVNVTNPDGQQTALLEGFTITNTSAPTPTPYSGGGSSSGSVSSQSSGSGGSGVSVADSAPAGSTVSYSFGSASLSYPISIESVTIVPDKSIGNSECIVTRDHPSEAFAVPDKPAAYQSIEIAWVNPNDIASGTISFSVMGTWLRENSIDPMNVVLMRQHDYVWYELPTTFDHQQGDLYYYTAVTPGFSSFAVSVNKTKNAVVNSTPTITPEPTAPINPDTPTITATPSPTITVLKTTVTPTKNVTPVTPALATSIPIWVWVAVFIGVGIIGGYFLRRWWIRRQNPALFQDYD